MTSQASTSDDARRVLRTSAAAFVLLSIIGVVYAAQHWVVGGPQGRLPWSRNLSDALIQWWTWAALAPAVLALAAKAPIQPGSVGRGLTLYLAAGAAASTVHLLTVALLLRGFDMVTPGEAFARTVSNLFKKRVGLDLLTFWALVLLGHAAAYHARWRSQEQAARRLGEDGVQPKPAAQKLAVRGRAGTILVDPADVAWIEAAGNYVVLHTPGGEHMMRATLDEILAQLGDGFVRISRSTLVSLAQVAALGERTPQGDMTLTLRDGARLRLTRTYRHGALGRLPRPR